jgi:hypothetical protein
MNNRRARVLACALSLLAPSGFGFSGATAQTAGPGLVYPPATAPNSFANGFYIGPGVGITLIGSSSSTVVLTSFSFENWYDQYNGAMASLMLVINYSTTTDCSQSAGVAWMGRIDAKPGQSSQITIPGGFTLKPKAPGQYWCLMANMAIQGNPSAYYLPMFGYTANLISGTVPATASAGVQAVVPGAEPPIGHRP